MVIRNLKELQLIRLSTAGLSKTEIARKLKVSRQTVSRWLNRKEIQLMQRKYVERQWELEMEYLERLQGVVVDTLLEILVNGTNGEKLRAIELYWRKMGELGEQINISGDIDIHNMSTEELEYKIAELRRKIYRLIGKEYCPEDEEEEEE